MTVICICVMNKCNQHTTAFICCACYLVFSQCNDTHAGIRTIHMHVRVHAHSHANYCYKYCNACTINNLCLYEHKHTTHAQPACVCAHTHKHKTDTRNNCNMILKCVILLDLCIWILISKGDSLFRRRINYSGIIYQDG